VDTEDWTHSQGLISVTQEGILLDYSDSDRSSFLRAVQCSTVEVDNCQFASRKVWWSDLYLEGGTPGEEITTKGILLVLEYLRA